MPNSLTSTGLTTASQAELLANQTAALQSIYGSDIDLSSNTPDGQWVNIQIQGQVDVQELITQVNASFDPDQAVGVQLDQRCAINGVIREGGTYSTTNITIVLSQTVLFLYGLDQSTNPFYSVSDNAGNIWYLLTTLTNVGPGTIVASFQSATPGANLTIPGTINIPVTVILGVVSVNNPTTQSIIGINEETDASLRIRRSQSVSISSQGYNAGLRAALLNINGIISAEVFENDTNGTDSQGIPGHTIWVVVDGVPTINPATPWSAVTVYSYAQIVSSGGLNYISWQNNNLNNIVTNTAFWGVYNPVAQTIFAKRNAGCGMFGSTSYTVTQQDGNLFIVNWDVVAEQNLYISFTATSINGTSQPNIAGIIAYLVQNYVFTVAGEININQVSTLAQQADPNCLLTNIGLSLALIQTAYLSGIAASGTFEISYNSLNSAAINWNDSASTIQTKIQAITGLGSATVTGSIASQHLVINLNVTSAASLLTIVNNSLQTSGAVPITFSFDEGYSNTLSPTLSKDKFTLNSSNIIILPMILSPTISTIAALGTLQLTGLGGYGTYTYSMQSAPTGGTINATTGIYTAGSTSGTDIALVTDAFGNTATATLLVT